VALEVRDAVGYLVMSSERAVRSHRNREHRGKRRSFLSHYPFKAELKCLRKRGCTVDKISPGVYTDHCSVLDLPVSLVAPAFKVPPVEEKLEVATLLFLGKLIGIGSPLCLARIAPP
jgi:hypothetical protein